MNNLTNTLFYLNYYTNLPKILEFFMVYIMLKQKFIKIIKVYIKPKIRQEK